MRPIRSLLIFMVVVFVGGALMAPCLYRLAQNAAGHWPALGELAAQRFPRYLDRALLGMAIIGLYPLLKTCRMWHWRDLGFQSRAPFSDLLRGFLLGFGSLAIAAILSVPIGHSTLHLDGLASRIASAALTAAIVAVVEEFIFRGSLFGILRKVVTWPEALVFSTTVYALAHFIQKANFVGPVHVWSGLALLPRMFHGESMPYVPAFFILFLVGSILALAYQRTGALYFSIGLHAGWIFWLKLYGLITEANLLASWLPVPILAGVFWIVWRMKPTAERPNGG